jgi:hypothetical protein
MGVVLRTPTSGMTVRLKARSTLQRTGARRCLTFVGLVSTRMRFALMLAVGGPLVTACTTGGHSVRQPAPPSSTQCCTARPTEPTRVNPSPTVDATGCEYQDLRLTQAQGQGVNSAMYLAGFQITDIGPGTCRIGGFPRVTLIAADRRVLPFHYRKAPDFVDLAREVLLRPGQTAGFQLVVWECAGGPRIVTRAARIKLPGVTPGFALPIRPRNVTYCTQARPNTIDVLPLSKH